MAKQDPKPLDDDFLDPFADLSIGDDELAQQLSTALVRKSQEALPDALTKRFRAMEDEIYGKALTVVSDAIHFRDIEPNATEPPKEWDALEPEERVKRLRMAKLAYMDKKHAPVGLDISLRVAIGIAKARAAEKEVVRPQLNVVAVIGKIELPKLEEIVVEREDR